jgi:histidinol dehydrogenase
VSDIFQVGGAQAIAAMAYGTESVPQVDKIVGPGNVYVTTAKLEVSQTTPIDIPAGPSEVLILADETANPAYVTADLLAQAEHDQEAIAILFTTSKELAYAVKQNLDTQHPISPPTQPDNVPNPLNTMIVLFDHLDQAIACANKIAPEHLAIQTSTPRTILKKIQNAGAVFLGSYSPVAFGDYSAGLNHVLPTGGYAKVYSGLSTGDFCKTINYLECTQQGFNTLKKTTLTIAALEGLLKHAKSVSIRSENHAA